MPIRDRRGAIFWRTTRSRPEEEANERTPIPFPFLAIVLVLLIVALLFVAYYLTRR